MSNLCGLEDNERSDYIFWSAFFLPKKKKEGRDLLYPEPIAGPNIVVDLLLFSEL